MSGSSDETRSQEEGIEVLRRSRGHEVVTFSDVADHLRDFVRIEPGSSRTVDALARFFAGVERVDHEHAEGIAGSTANRLEAVEKGQEF